MDASSQRDIASLTFNDLTVHPVWTWAEEDDESLVEPVDYAGALPKDHDALFVACEFSLRDGAKLAGMISVRMSDRFVYVLSFPDAVGEFFDFPLQPMFRDTVTREQLAVQLGKSVENIFPIKYSTPFLFGDGQRLEGQIE